MTSFPITTLLKHEIVVFIWPRKWSVEFHFLIQLMATQYHTRSFYRILWFRRQVITYWLRLSCFRVILIYEKDTENL